MGGLTTDETPSATGFEARLDSWKEIANYFSRDVTTVQRWEKREGMPVHRHLHDRMGSVYAYRAELDAWARGRNLRPTIQQELVSPPAEPAIPEPPAPPPSLKTRNFEGKRKWVLVLGAVVTLVIVAALCFQRTEYFWRNPIADFRFHTLTNFDGVKGAAAISRDGHFIAFLSDREGAVDVWVTQVGSGEFHNLTHGTLPGLLNPAIRAVGFSPDGSIVTCWVRRQGSAGDSDISVWGVPTLGGPRSHTSPAWQRWIGRPTALAWLTTPQGQAIPCLFLEWVGPRKIGQYSRPQPGFTHTFLSGRRTGLTFISCRVSCLTN